jgi:hypothetical protein
MVEESKSYEELEYRSKLERIQRERQTEEFWRCLNQPDTTRNPTDDVLGPEVVNSHPGLRPRPRGHDPLAPPCSIIDR